jgi:hypothetical protein
LVINTKKLSTGHRPRKRPKLQKAEALTPDLSTKTRIFMDRQDEIVPPSTKKPVSVDGTLKIRTPSTKSPLFVDGGGNIYGNVALKAS